MTAEVASKSRQKSPSRGSRPGERRGGRQKGTPNKLNAELKTMILTALDKAGGVDYLAGQAKASPSAFLALLGKVLPMQVTGDGGGPIRIAEIKLVAMANDDG